MKIILLIISYFFTLIWCLASERVPGAPREVFWKEIWCFLSLFGRHFGRNLGVFYYFFQLFAWLKSAIKLIVSSISTEMKLIYESALAPSLRPEGSEARHGHCSVTRLETLESYKLSFTCFKALFISPLDTLGRVVKFLYPTESLQHVWKLQK